MEIMVIRTSVTKADLDTMAKQQFGSLQRNLWGINLYPERSTSEWIEFDSMINVRPSGGNRSRYVEREEIRNAVMAIVNRLVQG